MNSSQAVRCRHFRSIWWVFCSENDEFCIQNDEFCIKNDEFCIKNDEFCIQNDGFCIKDGAFCIKRGSRSERVLAQPGCEGLSCCGEFRLDWPLIRWKTVLENRTGKQYWKTVSTETCSKCCCKSVSMVCLWITQSFNHSIMYFLTTNWWRHRWRHRVRHSVAASAVFRHF